MTSILQLRWVLGWLMIMAAGACYAQEQVAPVTYNPWLQSAAKSVRPLMKTTALALPFFEDFTGYGVFPDNTRWLDREVYVNNTMGQNPISRGVATFDALNARGIPYNTTNPLAVLYADSLTTQAIDLSAYTPADSIYLSFFYQPQGNGFSPETGDSLILFFKKKYNSSWTRVWAKEGTTVQPFKQVMIPVRDTAYFNDSFQFRFVNIASINLNDDVWNLDYIRMDRNRNVNDTLVNDVAATMDPTYLFKDYTYMPYRQYLANPALELAVNHTFHYRNNYTAPRTISYGYTARELAGGTVLGTGTGTGTLAAGTDQAFTFPVYTNTVTAPGPYARVVFEDKYYIAPISTSDPRANDTIVRQQVFDNYLAYDDGTAEKSYFLNQSSSLPAKIAVDFRLNQPDTLRGVAIYFGRQVPLATQKLFSIFVNKDIAFNGGTDQQIYQQDLNEPGYADTINHFWIYKFDTPVPLPAGVFYIGTIQPALGSSDSLYIGLDVNRTGGNHVYYNVLAQWQSSLVSGALMIRPLLGQPVTGTQVLSDAVASKDWRVYPNPATDLLYIDLPGAGTATGVELTDMQGRVILSGTISRQQPLNISSLTAGVYLLRIPGDRYHLPKKIVKL